MKEQELKEINTIVIQKIYALIYDSGSEEMREELMNLELLAASQAKELERAPKLWECPDCGFAFDAIHEDEEGGYSCPVCAELRLTKELEQTRDARDKALSKMANFEEMYEDERRAVEQLREQLNKAVEGLENAKMEYAASQTYPEGVGRLLKGISAVVSLLQGKEQKQ